MTSIQFTNGSKLMSFLNPSPYETTLTTYLEVSNPFCDVEVPSCVYLPSRMYEPFNSTIVLIYSVALTITRTRL